MDELIDKDWEGQFTPEAEVEAKLMSIQILEEALTAMDLNELNEMYKLLAVYLSPEDLEAFKKDWEGRVAMRSGQMEQMLEELNEARAKAIELTKSVGASVSGNGLYQAVYTEPKTVYRWNSDKLNGMASLLPEILEARTTKQQAARVSIRKKSGGGF